MAVASEFHSNISAHLGHWSTQVILQLTPYTQKTAALRCTCRSDFLPTISPLCDNQVPH